ncbi:MAG: cysteine--tRNA ligase [Planctomycetes bacterium]|nr:cysteine--tRNA ligase [Planctomycetota bacterium]
MTIVLHNTLTRKAEPLQPLREGHIGMYVCGPTVYDDCHIGHLMGPAIFDAVARWFTARGLRVRFVNNITDIDDKIINRSRETGEPWQAITERIIAQYNGWLKMLHVATITDQPRCTQYVAQMVRYVEELVAKGRAYVAADGVYYEVTRQENYGKLSGRRLDEMEAGARIERDAHLHHPADFALWKLAKPGEPSWPSPWGDGRPGWHIECSVMSSELLGGAFDIHGGGDDLKFPHHENEIAQAEAHGDAYASCWMHNGLVQYEGVKVGKSDPRMKDAAFRRQFMADHLIGTYGAPTIRFLLLSGHYRRPIDFGPAAIAAAKTALTRLLKQLGQRCEAPAAVADAAALARLLEPTLPPQADKARAAFCTALDDDINTGAAIAQLFTLASEANKAPEAQRGAILDVCCGLGRVIGLFQPGDLAALSAGSAAGAGDERLGQVMALVLELRQKARANRDFATSDLIRDRLKAAGITVKDGKDGATWE